MRVKVLFFGMLRDIVGLREEPLDLPSGASAGAVFDHYARRFPQLGGLAGSIVLARNHEFAARDAALAEGDEVALMPPVSGGSGRLWGVTHEIADDRHFFALTRRPIDCKRVTDRILRGEDGAVNCFEGVVRNNTKGRSTRFLEYECYESMAIKKMAEIGRELTSQYAVSRVALVHRLGRMLIGETSVAVIVTSPHRKPAFEAALEGINRLKRLVPIWKKEFFSDGEVWVEGEWDDRAPKADPR